MDKVIRFFDEAVDRVVALILILLMLLGLYFVYDTAYVYYNASAARVSYSRPGSVAAEAGNGKQLLSDYVCWLTIDDSQIDYPVMQAIDNSKYLNTDPYGDFSLSGSIFLDCRNAPDFSDDYSLLYGHHMSGGFMFGALDRFYDEAYFDTHRTGTLTVGDLVYPLQVFAVLVVDTNDADFFQPGEGEIDLEAVKTDALLHREPVSGHLLALTTCIDNDSPMRTVVLCAMREPLRSEAGLTVRDES